MSALIARGRTVQAFLSEQLGMVALPILILLFVSGVALARSQDSATGGASIGSTVTWSIAPARTADLIAQTSAAPAAIRATGDAARRLNASVPFSNDPIESATRFLVSGDGVSQQRALLCLTQAIYHEAGFEPLAGRRAVAQVVLNRMRHPAFPKSVCGVVYQGANSPVCQFSFVCDNSLNRAVTSRAWQEARSIAEAALAGYVEASVGTATHYHADYVFPKWASMLRKIEKIGAHVFYRWPGTWGRQSAFTGRYVGELWDPLSRAASEQMAVRTGETEAAASDVVSGPSEPFVGRAANDVGGLLDVSKGWTLRIPDPRELEQQSAKAVAQQEGAVQDTSLPAGETPSSLAALR